MKFELDYKIRIDEEDVAAGDLIANIDTHKENLDDFSSLEGAVVARSDGKEICGDHFDPVLRLINMWLQKIPWVIGGDTETLTLRDSEYCFAFIPSGSTVEFSFFSGTELEVEEYAFEPVNPLLSDFVAQSIKLGESLLALVEAVDADICSTNEDCKELKAAIDESKKAWRKFELHERR
ncbi:hypothetical protein KAI87_12615 [Myxococcota bacterium]|nr:hypothetical protein [Myxococcota bacterium]